MDAAQWLKLGVGLMVVVVALWQEMRMKSVKGRRRKSSQHKKRSKPIPKSVSKPTPKLTSKPQKKAKPPKEESTFRKEKEKIMASSPLGNPKKVIPQVEVVERVSEDEVAEVVETEMMPDLDLRAMVIGSELLRPKWQEDELWK